MTNAESDILWTLTRKVRVLSQWQIKSTWGGCVLGRLLKEDIISVVETICPTELQLTAPSVTWSPSDPLPDFGALSYAFKKRWRSRSSPLKLLYASRKAHRLVGGFIVDRKPRLSECAHDLHVAAIYLQIRKSEPARAKRWVSEHELYGLGFGQGEGLPDALIRDKHGRVDRHVVVEFAGAYSKRKLETFHDEQASRGLAYELW